MAKKKTQKQTNKNKTEQKPERQARSIRLEASIPIGPTRQEQKQGDGVWGMSQDPFCLELHGVKVTGNDRHHYRTGQPAPLKFSSAMQRDGQRGFREADLWQPNVAEGEIGRVPFPPKQEIPMAAPVPGGNTKGAMIKVGSKESQVQVLLGPRSLREVNEGRRIDFTLCHVCNIFKQDGRQPAKVYKPPKETNHHVPGSTDLLYVHRRPTGVSLSDKTMKQLFSPYL